IPIVTTYLSGFNSGNNLGGNPINSSNVQYRDTGVILSVVPRVNPGGLVYMELSQEVSKPGERDPASNNFPINKRSVETQIAVQSGETVLLGGFISEDNTRSESGVPGLSAIPIVGKLFGRSVDNKRRNELVVLITPRVIQTVVDARELTNQYQESFRLLRPLDLKTGQPTSRNIPRGTPDAEDDSIHEQEPSND